MTALLPGGEALVQGSLAMLHELGGLLAEITGMDEVTCQPLAGAHGEMTGIMLIAAYHRARGNQEEVRHRPRLLPRHQPGHRRHGRLRDHHRPDRPLRRHGP